MGPEATVDFMAKVIAMSGAERDQDHVHMIVDSDPSVPNRQVAIRTGNNDVTPKLAEMAALASAPWVGAIKSVSFERWFRRSAAVRAAWKIEAEYGDPGLATT